MQSFTYYKHSPINVEKSPRVHQHQRETSKNREKSNIKIDYNVDKLISQIETMKKNFEYEKQLLQSQYLQTTQNKLNQFKKVETELINKNQLIEQLLLQEQLKVVQLTRAMQEKNKVNYDKEKESLRSKIQYLEQQLIENQKSTQIKKTGTVEAATIQMIDIISQLQRLIIQTAKVKRLNLSWHDYDLLEVSLQAQRDKAKFLNQLQKIIQNFFKSLEGVQIQSVSPYRVVEENITPRSKQRNDHEQQRFQNYLQQIQMKQETKDTSVQVSFDTMDEEKIMQVVQEKLSIDQQTQTIKQQNHKVMTQTDFIIKEQQKVLQINSETQTEQKEKKQKKLAYKYCQTEKVTSVNQQCQTNSDQTLEVVKIKENQISYPQNQQTQTEQIKMIPFETQVNINKPSLEFSSQTDHIIKNLKDNSTEMRIIQQQQESQTIQKQFTTSLIQTIGVETQNNSVQTEQLQDQSVIKLQKEQKEPNQQNQQTFQSDIKKQVVSIEIAEESDDDSGSSFNVNSPTFSTPFASNVNNQDKLIKQKDEYIQRLQAKLVETVQHYEEELNKRANSLKFDIYVKSTQQSLQQLMDDKWEMSFKDKEAEQVYSIGFISFSQQLLNEIMCSLIDDQYKTKLELNTFYCKYYDKDFIENYRADLMFKALHNYEQIISDSQLKNQYLNYDMFWIDLIANNCKQLIYITDTHNFNDKRIIDYLITKNKPLTILSFQLEKFDGFISNKDFQQNQVKQFIQLQDDREILKIFLLQLFQGDLQWEPNETQFFQILQQQLGEIADIWDFQVTMKDDDQFDISIQSDTIQLKPIIPYIQSVQYEKGQIIIQVVNKQQIDNVLVNNNNMLVFFQDYMIIERLEQKAKLNKIEGSTIYLTY